MLLNPEQPSVSPPRGRRARWLAPLIAFAHRCPFITFLLLGIGLNLAGSLYNLFYNKFLVIDTLDAEQQQAFWHVLVPIYNPVAWSICLVLLIKRLAPLILCRWDMQAGKEIEPARLERCQRLVVDLPAYTVKVIFWGWMPGGIYFPLGISLRTGQVASMTIWVQFFLSFFVSAMVSSSQTFYAVETFLIKVVYPIFFQTARPAEIRGARQISLRWRLLIYWLAVAVVPMIALVLVALNATVLQHKVPQPEDRPDLLRWMAVGVLLGGVACSGLVSWIVGRMLLDWVHSLIEATEQIRLENYDVPITEKRPDEFGVLTDSFNDMKAGMKQAKRDRQTFGEFINPELRVEIWQRYPGLRADVAEVTVMFADIRGFTRRSAGQDPARVVAMLNRFLTLAVAAVEGPGHGDLVNKFLGDGFMAIFGALRPRNPHADLAVEAARTLVASLETLNCELAKEGEAPLAIGIGIHTGPALLGCIGATLTPGSIQEYRREFTAIGETVNLCSRIEQLTKKVGGPILISEATRARLCKPVKLTCMGPQPVPGYEGEIEVHRVEQC